MQPFGSHRQALLTIALAIALQAAACKGGTPGAVKSTKAPATTHIISDHGGGIIGDAGASIIGDAGASLISNNGGSLTGKVKIPAGIVSNNSGSLVSNNGGSIIGDAGASLTSKVKRKLLATGDLPATRFQVTLVDAGGTPFKDDKGAMFQAVTDDQGGYTFARTPRGANLLVRVDLPAAVGPMVAFVPDAPADAKRAVDVDGTSTLVMGYVLEAYVRTQAKPRDVLAKLPASVEADTRAKAIAAIGATWPARNFTGVGVRQAVGSLRAKDAGFDKQLDYVKSLLVAGLADLGDGQSATKVSLTYPTATAPLPDGSILIAERNADRVRRRWPDGHLTTFAGKAGARALGDGGSAEDAFIDKPVALAVDAQANVFVADFGHHRVRRIDAKTNVITTVAGNGGDPSGITTHYPFDGMDALQATLNHPVTLAVDAQGRVVFRGNNGTYRLEADGKLKGLEYPGGEEPLTVAAGPDGKVYGYHGTLGVVTVLEGDAFQPAAGFTPLPNAADPYLAVAADGSFYLATDLRIWHGTAAGWAELKLDLPHHDLKGPLATKDGLVVCEFEGNKLYQIPFAGGNAKQIAGLVPKSGDEPVAPEALGLNRPTTLAVDALGNLYVADGLNAVVWKRRPDGLYVRFAGMLDVATEVPTAAAVPAAKTAIGGLVGITARPDGHIYLIDGSKSTGLYLRDVDPSGQMTVVKLPAGVVVPTALGSELDGTLLVGDVLLGQVFRIKGDEAEALAPDSGVGQPGGLAAGPDGAVYVTSTKDSSVIKLVKNVATVIAGGGEGLAGDGGPATGAKFNYPLGLALDAGGRLYIADSRNDRVRRIDLATGIITTVVGPGGLALNGTAPDDSLKEPIGLAFDAEENLYIADSGHNQVKLVKRAALGP